jgi:hypothetical protein
VDFEMLRRGADGCEFSRRHVRRSWLTIAQHLFNLSCVCSSPSEFSMRLITASGLSTTTSRTGLTWCACCWCVSCFLARPSACRASSQCTRTSALVVCLARTVS